MEGKIMKNIIILILLGIILFDVSGKDFFDYIQKGLDKTQELVYDIQSRSK